MKNRLFLSLAMLFLASCGLLPGSNDYPLAESGPYHVGTMKMILYEDASRDGRKIYLTLWYPTASQPESGSSPLVDAPPDANGAPYPILLSSTKVGSIFAPLLVSHGFTYMGVNSQDSADTWDNWLIDYPLDLVFGFQQLAADPPEALEGILDTDHAGVLGYSFDSFSTLALGGARVDPEYYLAKCSNPSPDLPEWWIDYICTPSYDWEAFTAHAGESITSSGDGLWQAMTDERIRAIMPMGPEGAWIFGERGLAAVDRPALLIAAGEDTINLYDQEACFIYENLGVEEKGMVTFTGQGHMMIADQEMVTRMAHLAVAFLGHHLQGNAEYAEDYSEKFVERHEGLAWGIYP